MDIAKLNMYKKFDALEDVDLNTNLLALQQITAKWYATKPDNKDLQLLKDSVLTVTRIANKLTYEKSLYYKIISEYQSDKLRALERARTAEEKLNQVKPNIENL